MLQETEQMFEVFKNGVGYPLLILLPILILMSPLSISANEFTVFRTQQYEYQGVSKGSRTVLVNMEVRHLTSGVVSRRCMLALLEELNIAHYRAMISKGAGALLVLLPSTFDNLTATQKEKLMELEQELLQDDTQMPVYAAFETPELMEIYEMVLAQSPSTEIHSATEAMLSAVAENTYQFVISGAQANPIPDFQLVNLEGRLGGKGTENLLPTIIFVAHYDANAVFPSLAAGADSNASGIIALLEIMRLLSKLYSSSRTHPRYNIAFLLSSAGQYNYQGTKKWIEDQMESSEMGLLSNIHYALCVDSVGLAGGLYMHVSKPPKEGTPVDLFYQKAVHVSNKLTPNSPVQLVHKKINLAEESLSWEHERFNIKKLPAFTVSHFASHKGAVRNSLLDTRYKVDIDALATNVEIIIHALASQLFNLSESDEVFSQSLAVDKELLSAWLSYLVQSSRSAPLINKENSLLHTLEMTMAKYLKDVRRHTYRADKRDPEFVLYTGASFTMTAYRVKPAIFDLILGGIVAIYLLLIYFMLQKFGIIFSVVRMMTLSTKTKVN